MSQPDSFEEDPPREVPQADEGGTVVHISNSKKLDAKIVRLFKKRQTLEAQRKALLEEINKGKDELASEGFPKGIQNKNFKDWMVEQNDEDGAAKDARNTRDRADVVMRAALDIGVQGNLFE